MILTIVFIISGAGGTSVSNVKRREKFSMRQNMSMSVSWLPGECGRHNGWCERAG